jgi:hypothetical protein
MLIVIVLSVIVLSVIVLSVAYAVSHMHSVSKKALNVECHYAECRGAILKHTNINDSQHSLVSRI